MKQHAIIIGAGISGIATAVRLANKGFKVQVFEKEKKAGGKLNEFMLGDYRFDFGPSLFTMPMLVNELFELSGKNVGDFFSYQKIDLACKYFWQDGSKLMAWSDKYRLADEVEQLFGLNKKIIIDYLLNKEKIYKISSPVFLENSLHKFSGLFSHHSLRAIRHLPKMDIFTTMNRSNERRLKHPKLVQLFNRMATYNGSDPYSAPGILNIISSLEHGSGVFFPKGGMYSITKSLVNLAKELGVIFHYNEEVEEILISNDKAIGILTKKGQYDATVVISNIDVVPTYTKLMSQIKIPKRILTQERSSSSLVFYWGMDKKFTELELHNIFFSKHYKTEFNYIFHKKEIYSDPTIYLHISTKAEPDDAPKNGECWFVMINAPANYNQDWSQIKTKTREIIINKLENILHKSIREHIKEEWILDPQILEEKTSSYRGSLYGTSSNSRFSAFFRHPNFSRKIKNLYFTGGSVHPGGGIPLCLLSAKITSGLISNSKK